jgi:hypothetical protein
METNVIAKTDKYPEIVQRPLRYTMAIGSAEI